MILNYLKNHFLNKKAFFLYSLVLFYFFVFRDFAWAETVTQNANQAINSSIDVLNGLIAMITFVVQPLIMFVGWLLSPDWTFGDIINLRPVMHGIWLMISNFVYIIFAFMLVVIAFMNIFGKSESYAIKKKLPRLVVGILIVPFTWFIVSFTLSVSNVLTASVISLSYDSIKKFSPPEYIDQKIIPKKIIVDLRENTGATLPASEKTSDCKNNSGDCMSITDLFTNMKGAYNLLPYYAYNIFKIDKLKDISSKQTKDTINKTGDIFKKLTFSIVFALIFAILVIAIAYALVTRVFMLWIFAMFSPLFALDFFLEGKGLGKVGESLKNHMSITKFISLAMVPVYVSAALSFGLVFLSFAINNKYDKTSSFAVLKPATEDGKQIMEFGENTSKIQLTFIGNYTDTNGIAGDIFDTGAGFISNIIISFLALVILWMTVMAALKSDTITGNAVKPIAEFGNSIGKLALESPKYIPLKIPGMTGADGKSLGISMKGLDTLGSRISTSFEEKSRLEGSKFADRILGKNELSESVNNLATKISESSNKVTSGQVSALQKLIQDAKGDTNTIASNKTAVDELTKFKEILKKENLLPKELENLDPSKANDVAKLLSLADSIGEEKGIGNVLNKNTQRGHGHQNETRDSILKDYQNTGGSAKGDNKISLNLKDYTKGNKINVEIPGKDGKIEPKTITLSSKLDNKKEIVEELKGSLKESDKYDIEKLADEIISKNSNPPKA